MLFRNKFDYDYTDINKNLATLNSAVKGVRDNDKMKEVFVLILKIGNYLNYGTNKGKALGFHMDLLLQLSAIKSIGGKYKMSLLDFLIHSIRKSDPHLLTFTNDLVNCETASRIELSILTNKMKEFEKGLDKITKEVSKC